MSEHESRCNVLPATKVFWDLAYRKGHEAGLEDGLRKDLAGWAICFGLSMLAGFVLGWILGT